MKGLKEAIRKLLIDLGLISGEVEDIYTVIGDLTKDNYSLRWSAYDGHKRTLDIGIEIQCDWTIDTPAKVEFIAGEIRRRCRLNEVTLELWMGDKFLCFFYKDKHYK